MAQLDTIDAIGAVTHLLEERLHNHTGLDISVGRPGDNQSHSTGARLNLFLYEAVFDPTLKNTALTESQNPPLWLVLKFLLTPFDETGESDTRKAHLNLGKGLRALRDLTLLQLSSAVPADIQKALKDNPEELKITFDESTSDLLSKLMQGPDEKYRFSIAFQVRPVLITGTTPPSYNLLVGIDYLADTTIGEAGIQLGVWPKDMAVLDQLEQQKLEAGDDVIILGENLTLPGLKAYIHDQEMAIDANATTADRMKASMAALVTAHTLSAGEWPIMVTKPLPSGKALKSNLITGQVLPSITAAPAFTPNSDYGTISLSGTLLGGVEDAIAVALYQDGQVVKLYDDLPGTVNQTSLDVAITSATKPPAGTYRVILMVNGQQAKKSPEVVLP